jgi:muramoyltetrapeptide carboxypeptidase
MSIERARTCIGVLQDWGYQVRIGRTLENESSNYFSGSDQERLEDLQQMLDDGEIKAVLCARGGYGIGRIIEDIRFKKFRKAPKWIIGFSDVTVLHSHIHTNYGIATLHAPMASAFNDGEYEHEFVQSLKHALEGQKIKYHGAGHEFNQKGEAIGELVGGNLSLLAHLTGTSSDLKTKGKILFIEDTGEYIYNIDRMLFQLKRSGKLDQLAGLIVGGFTDMKDTERPFGKMVYEIIQDAVKGYDYPVCFGFPVSHEKQNYALKTGIGYKLKVSRKKVSLEE